MARVGAGYPLGIIAPMVFACLLGVIGPLVFVCSLGIIGPLGFA